MAQNDTINSFAPPVPSSPKEALDLTEPPQNNGSPPDGSIFATREGASVKFQELTGHILKFLSNASNETLGVCIVGLGAMTYLVLGRVGLVLIGVVGGVVLHATWEENNHAQADESVRASEARSKKERGLDIITRLLDWRDRERSRRLENDYVYEQVSVPSFSKDLDFSDFQSATGEALTSLTDAVIRDYVKYKTYLDYSIGMLTALDGGSLHYCLWRIPFLWPVGRPLYISFLHFPRIFRGRDLPTFSSTFSRILPQL